VDPVMVALKAEFGIEPGSREEQLWASIREAEDRFETAVHSDLGGYTALADAFQNFFLHTIDLALRADITNAPEEWGVFLIESLSAFRALRAAETTFRTGYPLAAFVLLRDLKDRAVYNAATLQGITSPAFSWGSEEIDGEPGQDQRVRRVRIKEERRVHSLMLGTKSGLSQPLTEELAGWEQHFNFEMHGSRLTFVSEFGPWIRREEALSLGPVLRESSSSEYFNRATEVGWLWMRLLPGLQWKEVGFGADWGRRWNILDQAFLRMEQSLSELGKPVADAIQELITKKFPFGPDFRYGNSIGK